MYYVKSGPYARLNKRRTPCRETVYREGKYRVLLLNNGKKRMPNPIPLNLDKDLAGCLVEGCKHRMDNVKGVCTHHLNPDTGTRIVWLPHLADWNGRIWRKGRGYFGGTEHSIAGHGEIAETLLRWAARDTSVRLRLLDDFVSSLLRAIPGELEDASTLQLKHESSNRRVREICNMINTNVTESFAKVGHPSRVRWVRSSGRLGKLIPIKLVAALLATAYAAEEINRGDLWFWRHKRGDDSLAGHAGSYMSAGYYLLRRVGAPPRQAGMALKSR